MRYLTLMLLMILFLTILTGCPRPAPSTIASFKAMPQFFCRLPHDVTLTWEATGPIRLEASSTVASLPVTVTGSGTRHVMVTDSSTTFTLTGVNGSPPARATVPVGSLVGGSPTKELGCPDPSCSGGELVCTHDYSEFDRDIVIRQARNTSSREITVQGPLLTAPLSIGRSDVFNGMSLAGVWTTSMRPITPCTATQGSREPMGPS